MPRLKPQPRGQPELNRPASSSFLFSLYGNDANSPRALKWAAKGTVPITLSPYNPFELGNALRFAEFLGVIRHGEAAMFWAQFESAVQAGRLLRPPCNLADVLDEATRLSGTHTLGGGHRGFDILHVAAALVLRGGPISHLRFRPEEAR